MEPLLLVAQIQIQDIPSPSPPASNQTLQLPLRQGNILGGPTIISKVFSYEVFCKDKSPQLGAVGMGQAVGSWAGGLWLHFPWDSKGTDPGLEGEHPTEQTPKVPLATDSS